jgi:hypothetical protein
MTLLLAVEASKADGSTYRVLMGWHFAPLASWVALISRLF